MSRKRGRDEEDNHLHEPTKKKAKLSKKDKKDKKSKNKLSKNAASTESEGTQLFNITEIVENILQYLILRPETVLSIAKVSRRYNTIVHTKSFWTRLGFTPKLSKTDLIEPQALKRLLIGLRQSYIKKKYKSNMAILETNSDLTKLISQSVDLNVEDQTVLGSDINAFLAQRTLTSEAYILLEKMRYNVNSRALRFFSVDDLITMVLTPDSKVEEISGKTIYDDHCLIDKYPDQDEDMMENGYYNLLTVHDAETSKELFLIKKKYINDDKSVVYLFSFGLHVSIYFISINEKTNMIECCGDLIFSALDPNKYPDNERFGQFDEDLLCHVSVFLSKSIFKLAKVNKNLAKEEFKAMKVKIKTQSIRSVNYYKKDQYYWENVPLYRK